MAGNNFFMKMCREAMEELAEGKEGWKGIETNTLILACFGMLMNHLAHKIVKPLWFVAASAGAAAIGYLVISGIKAAGG